MTDDGTRRADGATVVRVRVRDRRWIVALAGALVLIGLFATASWIVRGREALSRAWPMVVGATLMFGVPYVAGLVARCRVHFVADGLRIESVAGDRFVSWGDLRSLNAHGGTLHWLHIGLHPITPDSPEPQPVRVLGGGDGMRRVVREILRRRPDTEWGPNLKDWLAGPRPAHPLLRGGLLAALCGLGAWAVFGPAWTLSDPMHAIVIAGVAGFIGMMALSGPRGYLWPSHWMAGFAAIGALLVVAGAWLPLSRAGALLPEAALAAPVGVAAAAGLTAATLMPGRILRGALTGVALVALPLAVAARLHTIVEQTPPRTPVLLHGTAMTPCRLPDGRHLALVVASEDRRSQVLFVEAETSAATRIPFEGAIGLVGVHGRQALVREGRRGREEAILWVCGPSGRKVRIAEGRELRPKTPDDMLTRTSPDGERVLLSWVGDDGVALGVLRWDDVSVDVLPVTAPLPTPEWSDPRVGWRADGDVGWCAVERLGEERVRVRLHAWNPQDGARVVAGRVVPSMPRRVSLMPGGRHAEIRWDDRPTEVLSAPGAPETPPAPPAPARATVPERLPNWLTHGVDTSLVLRAPTAAVPSPDGRLDVRVTPMSVPLLEIRTADGRPVGSLPIGRLWMLSVAAWTPGGHTLAVLKPEFRDGELRHRLWIVRPSPD